EADILVLDQERASEILGPNPSYEFVFKVSKAVHEGPVYVASQKKLYLSQVYQMDGWFNKLADTPPQLPPATYRFRPSTGALTVVEDTLPQPNGIALAPNNHAVYISDTGAVSGYISPFLPSLGASFNATRKRTIYTFDLSDDATYLGSQQRFITRRTGRLMG
ncbi:MAG: hypothetical protein Q9204_007669, partial [Flavoplaca sp. TL-2023a]